MRADDPGHKHFNEEARRRRFDPAAKHGGYGGRSTVRAMPRADVSVDGYRDIYMTIRRPTDDDGSALVSELDMEFREFLRTDEEGKVAEDMPGAPFSGGHWFQLPELLEAECLSKSVHRDSACPSVLVTTYSLPGVSWMLPSGEDRARLEQRRAAKLSLALPDGHRICSRLRDAPLEVIPDKTLLDRRARLGASASGDHTCLPAFAKVLNDDSHHCWVAPVRLCSKAPEAYLEVDLGATCSITYVSTQGRFPAISHTDETTQLRVVHDGRPDYANWVTSYELSYRVVSGHDWIVLGELKGNADMTTEVAHELARVTPDGEPLVCRYLRFRPLTYNRLPAMRVGVYGERLDRPRTDVAPSQAAGSDNLIHYSIHCVKEQANLRRAPVGSGMCRYGCARCSKRRGLCKSSSKAWWPQRRRQLREGVAAALCDLAPVAEPSAAVEEASDPGAREPLPVLAEAGPKRTSARRFRRNLRRKAPQPAGAVVPPPMPPTPQRAESLADASSVSGSFVHVGDLDALSGVDSDGWLAV